MQMIESLVKVQSELENPRFDSINPHFRSKYASLAEIRNTITPVLTKHGFAVIQIPVNKDGMIGCKTILLHVSGDKIEGELFFPVSKQDAQSMGSLLTYARRYSLMSMLGIVGDEDDDANAACPTPKQLVPQKPTQTQKPQSYKSLLLRQFSTPKEAKEWVLSVAGKEHITEEEAKQLLEQNFQED